MNNKILLILIFVLVSCCRTKLQIAKYHSQCYLHGYPYVYLNLNIDSTFFYIWPIHNDTINGKWWTNKDTLYLNSKDFISLKNNYDTIFLSENEYTVFRTETYRYTSKHELYDSYLIKKDYLIPLIDTSYPKEKGKCYLKVD